MQIPQNEHPKTKMTPQILPITNQPVSPGTSDGWEFRRCAKSLQMWKRPWNDLKNHEMLIPNEDRLITVLLPNLPQKPSQGTFEIEMFNKCFVGFSSWCFLSRRIWCIWVGLADQRSLFWCIITSKHNAAKYFWKRFYIILMYYDFVFMAFSTATCFHVPNKDFLMFMATKEMFCG